MNEQSKKIFSVILALLIGAGIIFFALKNDSVLGTKNTPQSKLQKNSLTVTSSGYPKKILRGNSVRASEGVATTTTDIIARELLVTYAVNQKVDETKTMSDAEAETLAQSLMEKIKLPQAKQYTEKNLNISPDNSIPSLTTYAKNVNGFMQTFSATRTTNELVVVAEAISDNDVKKLEGLSTIALGYGILKKELLAVKTPSVVASLHLRLVQSYTNIENTIVLMQTLFNDPVQGLAALIEYKKEITLLNTLATEYRDYTPPR